MFYFLSLSAIIFASGLYGVLTRRTLSAMLPSIFLMLVASAFNCIVFNSLILTDDPAGYLFGLAVVVVGVATVVIGKRFDRKVGDAKDTTGATQPRSQNSPESLPQNSEPMASDA
jgi:NADH:ubiquinone oxidoreductase subunit K